MKVVLEKLGKKVNGVPFTSYTFQAIVWKYGIKEKEQYCWHNKNTNTYQYSNDLIAWLKKLTAEEIQMALQEYRQYMQKRRKNSS